MRHRISGYHLGRTTNQRKNLYRSQLRSLFTHGYIKTTVTKAKSIAPLAEKIALSAVKADLNSRRYIFTFFQDRNVVNNIVNTFTSTFSGQTQNFTQMSNVKYRQGDNALIVRLSFVKDVKCVSPTISKADKKIASDKIKASFGGKVKEVTKKVATKKTSKKKEIKK